MRKQNRQSLSAEHSVGEIVDLLAVLLECRGGTCDDHEVNLAVLALQTLDLQFADVGDLDQLQVLAGAVGSGNLRRITVCAAGEVDLGGGGQVNALEGAIGTDDRAAALGEGEQECLLSAGASHIDGLILIQQLVELSGIICGIEDLALLGLDAEDGIVILHAAGNTVSVAQLSAVLGRIVHVGKPSELGVVIGFTCLIPEPCNLHGPITACSGIRSAADIK